MENYVAIIPARKGSKTIKNKNLIKIRGKRLIDYTIGAAKKTKKISKIVISTDIRSLLKKNTDREIYIKRPKILAKDKTTTESVIFHVIKQLKQKKIKTLNLILLQPTSPFRNNIDINDSIKLFEEKKLDSLFSAFKSKFLVWQNFKNKFKPINYNILNRKRRQDSKSLIIENGAIFIFKYKKFIKSRVRLFGKIGCFIMSKKNSVEIDDKLDLKIARKL
jgi:CMP-N,N'-diacetyllegionaminic acid synthase